MIIISELFAHFGCFVDIYGNQALADKTFEAEPPQRQKFKFLDVMIGTMTQYLDQYLGPRSAYDKQTKERLYVMTFAAISILAKVLEVRDPDLVLTYLRTSTSLDQIISLLKKESAAAGLLKGYVAQLSYTMPNWETSEVKIGAHSRLRAQYDHFANAYRQSTAQ